MPGSSRALTDGMIHDSVFVAATARLRGRIFAAENSSIWFGCELDAGEGEIVIGPGTNVQDNTLIRCRPGERFVIGADATIGHNVTLGDCTIGANTLIGIGSVVRQRHRRGGRRLPRRRRPYDRGPGAGGRLAVGQAPGGEDRPARPGEAQGDDHHPAALRRLRPRLRQGAAGSKIPSPLAGEG